MRHNNSSVELQNYTELQTMIHISIGNENMYEFRFQIRDCKFIY